jgi:hypothetical protein
MRNHDLVGYFDSEQENLPNSTPAQLAQAQQQHEQHFENGPRRIPKRIADLG